MGRRSKRKTIKELAEYAQHYAQLLQSLDVDTVRAWSQQYVLQYGKEQFVKLHEYATKHYPDEVDTYYNQIILPEKLKELNISSEKEATIHRIVDEEGRKKTLIIRKSQVKNERLG